LQFANGAESRIITCYKLYGHFEEKRKLGLNENDYNFRQF